MKLIKNRIALKRCRSDETTLHKVRHDKDKVWKLVTHTAVFLICMLCFMGAFAQAAEKEETVGIKKTLGVSIDGAGLSYLNYISPVSGKEYRVSLHETSDGLMAYCLDRTKDSDYSDYNYNYEEVSNYSKEASDLQRNILLCGYPGNTVKELENMYGYEINRRCAAQATQMAIWICNYMYDENVSMSNAWKAHKPKNTGDYKAIELSKAILNRAFDMLNQNFEISCTQSGESGGMVTFDFLISTKAQYYPLEGKLMGLPEGSTVEVGDTISYDNDGTVIVNQVEGEGKMSVTFSKYVDASKVELSLNGTIPVPHSYAGILYYENTDSNYQSVVVVKEAKPSYSEKKASFSRTADQQMKISIKKEDSEGTLPQGDAVLAGAEYTIYDSQGNVKEVLTIGEDGQAVSGNLPIDIYTVKETKCPEGYKLDDVVYTVDGTLEESTESILTFSVLSKEEVIKGKIRIHKTLENPIEGSTEKIPAKDAIFTYYLNSNPEEKMTITLDENGEGESGWIPYGTYTLEETEAPEGWKEVAPITVEVKEEGQILTYDMEDGLDVLPGKCRLVIKKVGARFTTVENASWGEYQVQIPVFTECPLEGCEFTLTACEDIKIVGNIYSMREGESLVVTTDQEGKASFENLYPGLYELTETKGVDGFICDSTPKRIQLEASEDPLVVAQTEVDYVNVRQKMNLLIEKQMEQKEDGSTENAYQEVVFGVFTKEAVVGTDETTRIEAHTLVDIYTINGDGRGVSQLQTELPYGSYYVKELETAPEYILDETEHEFTFLYEQTEGKMQEISLTEEPIVNQLIPEEPEEPEKPTQPDKPKKTVAPKTGDESEIFWWTVSALISGAVIALYCLLHYKKYHNKKKS